ncbi:hypothetical protein Q5752_004266 [Cryptotrichosporon argae]
MDQDAFRSLLFAPRAEGSSSSSRKVLGGHAPKRGWGLKPKAGTEKKAEDTKPAFKPRSQRKPQDEDKDRYLDRAKMRRQGVEDEFQPVQQMHDEFERRKAAATDAEERAKIEAQRAYLGGDATHSVLVKGLDYSLLAARRAELEREQADDVEGELDALLGAGTRGKGKDGEDKGEGERVVKEKEKEQLGSKKEAPPKKKKKKKVKASEPAAAPTVAPTAEHAQPVPSARPADVESAAAVPKGEVVDDVDEDEDIFGGVGTYDFAANVPGSDVDSDDDVKPAAAGRAGRDERATEGRKMSDDGRPAGRKEDGDRHGRDDERRGDRFDRRDRSADGYDRYERERDRDRRERYSDRHDDRGRYDHYERRRSRSRERYARYHRDERYDRDGHRYDRDGRIDRHDQRHDRYDRNNRHGHGRSRSRSRERYSHERAGHHGASRSPPAKRPRSPSASRSRSPRRASPPRARQRTRSLTPTLAFDVPRSPTPSDSDDDDVRGGGPGPMGRLQPLASSAMADVRSFLAHDEAGAKAADKAARKARWRAAQGLPTQEGAGDARELDDRGKERADKLKQNRDYVLLMNKMKDKDKA